MRSVSSASLAAAASLPFLVVCLPTPAHAGGSITGANYPIVKYLDGQRVVHTSCEWHNFFQSMNMWPRYRICPGKSEHSSFGQYLSSSSASSSLDIFLALTRGQGNDRADYVTPVGTVELSFKIGDIWRRASVCAWYNLFQSRYRTPLYVKCANRTNDQSFGRFSEPDYWKKRRALNQQKAPDILGFIGGHAGASALTLPINGVKRTLSICQWHNFVQSFNPTPRFVKCEGESVEASYKVYSSGANIEALKVIGSGRRGASLDGFEHDVNIIFGHKRVSLKRCALYNWLQSNIRWPIYRACGSETRQQIVSGDRTVYPARDEVFSYNYNYKD